MHKKTTVAYRSASAPELPHMPEKTHAQQVAEQYLVTKARIAMLKEELDLKGEEVMHAMKSEGLPFLTASWEGERFRFELSEKQEKLVCKKAQ